MAAVNQAANTKMDTWLSSKIYDKSVYLYLVDELTGMPVAPVPGDSPTYPIEIKKPKEQMRELVPLMCLGITAMALVSNGGGLARMFGIPVPSLSKAALDKMRAFAKKMEKSNTAEQFDCMQASICDPSNKSADTKKMRGNALTQFDAFLKEHDKDKNYAGLRRVMTECGAVLWTKENNVDPLSLGSQVLAITEEKNQLTEEKNQLKGKVEELEKRLEAMSTASIPPARVPPPPPPKHKEAHGVVQLENKSGWLYKKGSMMNTAYQKRYFVLQGGMFAWYSNCTEQMNEQDKLKQQNGWVSCCGLEIETDTGENGKGRACFTFTIKARSGSTTRRIQLACENASERLEWVRTLEQLQSVQLALPSTKVLFAQVMAQVRNHAGAPPRSLATPRLARTT